MAKEHEYTPLYSADDSSRFEQIQADITFRRLRQRLRVVHILTYTLLIISNLGFAALWLREQRSSRDADCVRPQLIHSPAREVVRYEKRRLFRDIGKDNPFVGRPRPELDEAWRHIVDPMTIKISEDEFSASNLGDPTIPFKDGSGYIAEMAVYHELHCIKRIRRAFHMDYYYPNMDDAERDFENVHIDHCLEYWREAAMCRGDVSLGTFFWRKDGPTSRVYTDHECVDWTALDTWARGRMVNMSDLTQFDKPVDVAEIPQYNPGDH